MRQSKLPDGLARRGLPARLHRMHNAAMSRSIDHERPQGEGGRSKRPQPSSSKSEEHAQMEAIRKAVGNAGMASMIDRSTTDTIESALGGGRPLSEVAPASDAAQKDAVGDDSDVRVHDDATAASLSRNLGAVAFTFGRDIFLAADAPELDTPAGKEMLQHELTHVRQQQGSATGSPTRVSSPDSPAEQEAYAAAAAGPSSEANAAPASSVHRQGMEEEEELQMLRADTVQREELPEEEVAKNPALGVMFDVSVMDKVSAGYNALGAETPDPVAAFDSLGEAVRALAALAEVYETSDRELEMEIRAYRGGLNTVREALGPLAGTTRNIDQVHSAMATAVSSGQAIRGRLH
jgi:hypothetical protein